MAEEAPEKFRSFTIRVPMSRYLQMTEMAEKEGLALNPKVNQIIALGLGEHIRLDEVLVRLIKTSMTAEGQPKDG